MCKFLNIFRSRYNLILTQKLLTAFFLQCRLNSVSYTHLDVYKRQALDTALRYVEQQAEATPTDTMLLRRWRDIAAKKRGSILKQKTLDNFFKK